jgi:CelD/BcsL family acetyltransferase involved in cellulose biosynthesis
MKSTFLPKAGVWRSSVPTTTTHSPKERPTAVLANVQIGGEELVHRFADRWERLCEETRSAPFHRPEWIATYLRAFEPQSEVVLLTASAGDRLVAVLPMIRKRAWFAGVPIWKLSGAANVHSVRFDILHASCEAGEVAIRVFWEALRNMAGWHILEMPLIPENGACQKLIAHASEDGYRTITSHFHDGPILRMKEDEKGQLNWLHGTSRHFRHELRRFARLLAEEAGGNPKLVRRADPDARTLEDFFKLEASGWKGEEGSAINCAPETRAFYDQIAREASSRGYFCLHSLETDARMVAGAFSVETEQCFYPMKIAYDEELRRGGPGQLLFNGIFAECAEKRIPELFFGGKNDRYKTSWTSDTLPHFNGFIFSRAFRARLVYEAKTNLFPRLGRLRRGIRGQFKPWKKPSDSTPKVKSNNESTAKRPHDTEIAE